MKTITAVLVTFALLMSCEEENPQPVSPFVGSWSLTAVDVPITISFDVVYEGATTGSPDGIYNYYNVKVAHPAIQEDEQTNCTMITYDRFANGDGFGRIEITSRGSNHYKIIMIYNRITDEGMGVYDVQIDIPSEPFTVLNDQVFTRND